MPMQLFIVWGEDILCIISLRISPCLFTRTWFFSGKHKHVCGPRRTTFPCPVISGWIEAQSKALLCAERLLQQEGWNTADFSRRASGGLSLITRVSCHCTILPLSGSGSWLASGGEIEQRLGNVTELTAGRFQNKAGRMRIGSCWISWSPLLTPISKVLGLFSHFLLRVLKRL